MQSATKSSLGAVVRTSWRLSFMLGLASAAFLQAASNLAPMVDAAKADNLSSVRKLLKDRAEVNATAADGSSALLWAAYHSNVEMAKALIDAGATIDAANRYGVTPLLQASRTGDVETMKVLLDAGAQATRWHAEGETPLMAASRTGSVDAVKLLLSKGAFVNAVDPFQEETALMWASAEGHVEVVKTLLGAGADPNLKAHVSTITTRRNADHPSGGFTALMFAARNGHDEVVKVLMKNGADPKLTNADGGTATIVAILNDRFDLAKELIDLGADPNDGSLFFAVDMHDQTYDTRAQDATRMQPDHENKLSALSLVKALLDVGADVNKPFQGAMHSTSMCCATNFKSSPFYRAATAADVEVLKLLLAKGAKVEWTPAEIKTDAKPAAGPPGAAAAGGPGANAAAQTALMLVMKGGGGPPIQGGPGYTRGPGIPPYREPGSREAVEATKLLLAAGANANAKGPDGSTPLHQAVTAQQVEMIRALVAAGAKLDVGNKDNLTPLALAEKIPTTVAPVNPGAVGAAPASRLKKDSKEEVVAVLRELMHLGPNDPVPPASTPPPAPAKIKPAPAKAKPAPVEDKSDEKVGDDAQ